MRIATLGLLAVLASATTASAADLDYGYLRGADDDYVAAPVIDWSGFYIGGHGGYSSAGFGFGNAFQPIVAHALRYTVEEDVFRASSLLSTRSKNTGGPSYGAFAGYNIQIDEVVFGIEADYTYFGEHGKSYDSISRFTNTPDGYFRVIDLNGVASTKLDDYGTVRGRLGYAFGSFLPFVTGGVAIGRATIADTVNVRNYGYDEATYRSNLTSTNPAQVNSYGYSLFNQANPGFSILGPYSTYGGTKKVTIGGVALGAGVEFAVTPNILLRGEYQYVLFNDFKGHSAEVNTVRGGAAVKF